MSDDFKKIAAREIEEFKAEYRVRFPGRDAESLTDEDLLREVMNTVGKAGKLGEHVKCVVSVSMLTEGWDANTVTHILGVRAFGTQLLCEQVVGRALRRMSYAANDDGLFDPEYAEVYGVPFSFIPSSGQPQIPSPAHAHPRPRPGKPHRLRDHLPAAARLPLRPRRRAADRDLHRRVAAGALHRRHPDQDRERAHRRRIQHPHAGRPQAPPAQRGRLPAGQADAGEVLPRRRRQRQALAFPATAGITKRWLAECVTLKDNTFPQLLLLIEFAHDAADRIYKAIVAATDGTASAQAHPAPLRHARLHPLRGFRHHPARLRHPRRQVPHLPRRRRYRSWEQKLAQALEDMPEVVRYVKNHNLGFTIPYTLNGEEHQYMPDFIADFIACPRRTGPGEGPAEPDHRGHRREEEGQGRQGRHRTHAVGAGRQQPRRLRTLGLHRGHRSVGCRECDPGDACASVVTTSVVPCHGATKVATTNTSSCTCR